METFQQLSQLSKKLKRIEIMLKQQQKSKQKHNHKLSIRNRREDSCIPELGIDIDGNTTRQYGLSSQRGGGRYITFCWIRFLFYCVVVGLQLLLFLSVFTVLETIKE